MNIINVYQSLFWKNGIIEITIFQQSTLYYTFENIFFKKNSRILIFSRREIFRLIETMR